MNNKTLSEQCIEYCDILRNYRTTEYKIREKILEIVKLYNSHAYIIDRYYYDNGNLDVYYTESFCGCSDFGSWFFPIKWLDLDKEEIRKLVEAEIEEMRKEAERREKEKQEKEQQDAEIRERQEYERLKAKYGNNDEK